MTIPEIYCLFLKTTGVTTDTRKVKKGELFVALKGGNFNGNQYADHAIELGASFVLIDEETFYKDDRYILVDDCLHSLQLLANYHRQQFNIPVLAITGTNGKTTSKELITSVLSKKYNVTSTNGNLNNHIGVPLTLLSISKSTEIAIIEMGANKIGDIRELCSFANPTVGAIVNVGRAHLEGFGSFEGIVQTKTELYDFLYNSKGDVFVNGKQNRLKYNAQRFKKVHYFQNDESNMYTSVGFSNTLEIEAPNGSRISSKLIGVYNLDNVALAAEIGHYFNVDQEQINQVIIDYVPSNNRSQVIINKKGTILLDAYNANPSSMSVALENLSLAGVAKYAILGDMFELGSYADEEHKKIIDSNVLNGIKTLYCGDFFWKHQSAYPNESFFKTREDLVSYLKNQDVWVSEEYCLLIKGSRGMALEKILEEVTF